MQEKKRRVEQKPLHFGRDHFQTGRRNRVLGTAFLGGQNRTTNKFTNSSVKQNTTTKKRRHDHFRRDKYRNRGRTLREEG